MRREAWFHAALLLLALTLGGLRCREARVVAFDDAARLAPAFGKLTGTIASDVDLRGLENANEAETGTGEKSEHPKPRAAFTLAAQSLEIGPRTYAVSGFTQISLPLDSAKPSKTFPRYGETVLLTGKIDFPEPLRNPGGFDYRAHLTKRGIYTTLVVRRSEDWRIISETNGSPILRFAFFLRARILQNNRDTLAPEPAAVLNGILLGSKSDLPLDLQDSFERTGTSHILATAGLHIGIFVGLLFGLLRLSSVGRKPASFLCLLALVLFAIMAGGAALCSAGIPRSGPVSGGVSVRARTGLVEYHRLRGAGFADAESAAAF